MHRTRNTNSYIYSWRCKLATSLAALFEAANGRIVTRSAIMLGARAHYTISAVSMDAIFCYLNLVLIFIPVIITIFELLLFFILLQTDLAKL